MIDTRIQKFFYKTDRVNIDTAESVISPTPGPVHYKGICFIKSVSENIGRIACKDVMELKVGYKPYKTNRTNFSTLKDRSSKNDKSYVVYKVPCLGDGFSKKRCDLCYIGQTGNKLGTRMEQHRTDLIRSNDDSQSKNGQTALVRHFQDGHGPDFDNVSILLTEPNDFKRKVLESLSILTNNSVNFRRDTDNVSKTYHGLINVEFPSSD